MSRNKLTGAFVIVATIVIVTVVYMNVRPADVHLSRSSSGVAPPTPSICIGVPGCRAIIPVQFPTLEKAAEGASCHPKLPENVPDGFEVYSVEFIRHADPPISKIIHNDWITVRYRNAAGNSLIVSQGFPALPCIGGFPSSEGPYELARLDEKGVVTVHGKTGYWLRGASWQSVEPEFQSDIARIPDLPSGGLMLAWEVGRFAQGTKISPVPNEASSGSPFSYCVMSDSLPLAELIKIAASVPLAEAARPE